MHEPLRFIRTAVPVLFAFGLGCAHPGTRPGAVPARRVIAPDSFLVSIETSRGALTLFVHRPWAPSGVDRFYELLQRHYYDGARFFRIVPDFVAQFGLAADPQLTAEFRKRPIPDDSVRQSNVRGTISFARSGPASRTAQLFINLADNSDLDHTDGFGFPPIGQVASGIGVLDQLNAEYSASMPSQDSISRQGNAYLMRAYPRLDFIRTMKIVKRWKK